MKASRVRIDQPGYENFNEELSGVKFTNGVSDEPVPVLLQNMLGAVFRLVAVDAEEETQVGAAVYQNLKRDEVVAEVVEEKKTDAELTEGEESTEPTEPTEDTESTEETRPSWTQEALEKIADDQGIKGLREIAEPMGLKGTSIAALIKAILDKTAE